ncbi:MAG: septation protein IspZ, partial [bacterium]
MRHVTLTPTQRFILDFAPLALFFLAYRFGGLMAATATLMAATFTSITLSY